MRTLSLSACLPSVPSRFKEDPSIPLQKALLALGHTRKRPLAIDALKHYIGAICGVDFDRSNLDRPFFHAIEGLNRQRRCEHNAAILPHANSLLLAALYMSLCQASAFSENGYFNLPAFVTFVAFHCHMTHNEARTWLDVDVDRPALNAIRLAMRAGSDKLHFIIDCMPLSTALLPIGKFHAKCENIQTLLGNTWLHHAVLDLDGVVLTDFDLSIPHLRGATLTGASFIRSRLSSLTEQPALLDMSFVGCSWDRADWRDAWVQGCTFRENHFSNACFDRSLFSDVSVCDTVFSACTSENMRWQGTQQRQAIERTRFHQCDFRNLQLSDTAFLACDFRDTSLPAVPGTDGAISAITRCAFRHCAFAGWSFAGAQLNDVLFSERCSLRRADFTASTLRDVTFGAVNLEEVRFDDARLHYVHASNLTTLRHTSFLRAHIHRTTFAGNISEPAGHSRLIRFYGADFTDARLHQVTFSLCRLDRARFIRTHMASTRFQYCYLDEADLSYSRGADILTCQNSTIATIGGCDIELSLCLRLLDPSGNTPYADIQCYVRTLLLRINQLADPPMRLRPMRELLNALHPHLSSGEGREALQAVNIELVTLLCEPHYQADPVISNRFDEQLHACLTQLNGTSGLVHSPLPESAHVLANRVARLLCVLPDDSQVRRLSALFCHLLASATHAELIIADDVLHRLTERYLSALPLALHSAFKEVTDLPLSHLPLVHLACITEDGNAAIILPHTAWQTLLITPDPDQPGPVSYYHFIRRDDAYVCLPRSAILRDLRPFPKLAQGVCTNRALIAGWIGLYALPAPWAQHFVDGLTQCEVIKFVAPEAQIALMSMLTPWSYTKPGRRGNAPNAAATGYVPDLNTAQRRRLRPDHVAALQSVWSDVLATRDNAYRTALLLTAVSWNFLRAASIDYFGTEQESPLALRDYAGCAINTAMRISPVRLIEAETHTLLLDGIYGLQSAANDDGVVTCAELLSHLLVPVFNDAKGIDPAAARRVDRYIRLQH